MKNSKILFVAFSHKLTESQIDDAKHTLNADCVSMKDTAPELQKVFSQVPATATTVEIKTLAKKIVREAQAQNADFILCAGEPTLMIHTNLLARDAGIICIQSTTERISTDTPQPDGTIKKVQIFKHVQFRNLFEEEGKEEDVDIDERPAEIIKAFRSAEDDKHFSQGYAAIVIHHGEIIATWERNKGDVIFSTESFKEEWRLGAWTDQDILKAAKVKVTKPSAPAFEMTKDSIIAPESKVAILIESREELKEVLSLLIEWGFGDHENRFMYPEHWTDRMIGLYCIRPSKGRLGYVQMSDKKYYEEEKCNIMPSSEFLKALKKITKN